MRLTFFLLFFIGIAFTANAQIFEGGVVVAINGAQIDGDDQSGFKKPGLMLGAFVTTKVGEKGEAELGMFYVGKGSQNNDVDIKNTLHYLEIPAIWYPFSWKGFKVGAGLYSDFLISATIKSGGDEYTHDDLDFRKFNFGGIASVHYALGEKSTINLRYARGFHSTRKNTYWVNQSLSIGVSYKF